MTVRVLIPTVLRRATQGLSEVSLAGGTIADCIEGMEARFPGIKDRLCDENGEIRRFVNIYVNGEDVRFLAGGATALRAGDEVSIVPAVAGGQLPQEVLP